MCKSVHAKCFTQGKMLQVIQLYISRHQISWYPNMWAQVWQILWHKGFNKISLRRTSSEKLVRRAWFRMIGLPMCWSRRWIEVSDLRNTTNTQAGILYLRNILIRWTVWQIWMACWFAMDGLTFHSFTHRWVTSQEWIICL